MLVIETPQMSCRGDSVQAGFGGIGGLQILGSGSDRGLGGTDPARSDTTNVEVHCSSLQPILTTDQIKHIGSRRERDNTSSDKNHRSP